MEGRPNVSAKTRLRSVAPAYRQPLLLGVVATNENRGALLLILRHIKRYASHVSH